MDEAKVIEQVRSRMGHPQVKIELNDDQIKDAISDALKCFSRIKPKIMFGSTKSLCNNGSYYVLTAADKENLIEVVNCDYKNLIKQTYNYSGLIDVAVLPYEWQLRSDRYTASMQKVAMDAAALGYDGDWKYDENTGRIYFNPPITSNVLVNYWLSKIRSLSEIPKIDEDTFKDLVESFCRNRLADIRGKYKGIPSPTGSLDMDASEQRAEAKDLREKAEALLKSQQMPMGFFYAD